MGKSLLKTLIIKLGAAGDVIRTTTLLNILEGEIHWLTKDSNIVLLRNIPRIRNCIPWSKVNALKNTEYNRVINLEDSLDTAQLLRKIRYIDLFGAYLDNSERLIQKVLKSGLILV